MLQMTFDFGFLLGVLLGLVIHLLCLQAYKNNLANKADAPKRGQSNREFILGKPYVIMHDEEYVKNCLVWYE